jgi:hypothetical protein
VKVLVRTIAYGAVPTPATVSTSTTRSFWYCGVHRFEALDAGLGLLTVTAAAGGPAAVIATGLFVAVVALSVAAADGVGDVVPFAAALCVVVPQAVSSAAAPPAVSTRAVCRRAVRVMVCVLPATPGSVRPNRGL